MAITFVTLSAKSYGGTLIGTAAKERFIGSGAFDLIYGGSGIDLLYGNGGNDWLNGDRENDTLYGGKGDDELYGGRKNLTYTGAGDGDDLLYGEQGNDKLYGGTGDDKLYGGSQNDKLYGSTGDDELYGGGDNDYLDGEEGNDALRGGFGADILIGNSANDTLSAIDILTGESGLDWFSFERPAVGVGYTDPLTGALEQPAPGVDRITDFTPGKDKILLDASAFNNLTTSGANKIPAGQPLAASVFPGTQFYRLDASDFKKVTTIGDLATATAKIVAVVQGEAPYVGAANPQTYFPALFYSDGTGYKEFAVLTNGVVPRIAASGNINDFVVY
jgi:Ca2+-binding RTX toxin-like protein